MQRHATLCCAVALSTQIASPLAADTTTTAGLDGSYVSIACEVRPLPNQDGTMGEWWLKRDITITDGRIDAIFTTYAGPGCGFALQELHFGGDVDIVGPSDVITGAVEADLTIDDYVRIKPLAEDFAAFLNSAPEGACLSADWRVGEARDILEEGCLVLGVQPNTPTVEYEILAAQGDMIYFGAPPDRWYLHRVPRQTPLGPPRGGGAQVRRTRKSRPRGLSGLGAAIAKA